VKILFDTNIVLDVLFDREPFSELACKLFTMVEKKQIDGFLGATSVTTI
jgi:predicted nucleic acid-binding protein